MTNGKRTRLTMLFILGVMLFSGCGNDNEETQPLGIHLYANIPSSQGADFGEVLKQETEADIDLEVNVSPDVAEKLLVELAGRNGDIYIAKKTRLDNMLKQKGLVPLDSLFDGDVPEHLQPYRLKSEDADEKRLVAIALTKDSTVFEKAGIELNGTWLAILPEFSENHDKALKVMALLAEREN